MNDSIFLNYNGKFFKSDALLLSADNRSFRYGDGFFETMKMVNEKIILSDLHYERLFNSLKQLQFEERKNFSKEFLEEQILLLVKKNNHSKSARIRLTIFRGNGGLYDVENNYANFIIQTWNLESQNKLNENGLIIDIYEDAKKCCDNFSHIKSNNFLPYSMAAMWAKQNKLNDALLLNNSDRIADATIANIFIIKDKVIQTPMLDEGCIDGVMRRYLLYCFKQNNIAFKEIKMSLKDMLEASEIFLTNSIFGIKWVKQIGKKGYKNYETENLYRQFILPLHQ